MDWPWYKGHVGFQFSRKVWQPHNQVLIPIYYVFNKKKLLQNPVKIYEICTWMNDSRSADEQDKYLASMMACCIFQDNWIVLVCYHNFNYPFLLWNKQPTNKMSFLPSVQQLESEKRTSALCAIWYSCSFNVCHVLGFIFCLVQVQEQDLLPAFSFLLDTG